MSEILAFIRAHRRDIIITVSALAASLVVMLLVPAVIMAAAPSDAGMMACIALFFALDPMFCIAAAVFAGWDLRRRWFTALFPPLAFLLSEGAVFGAEAGGFTVYFVIYSALCVTVAPVTHLVRKYGKSES